MPVAPYIQIPLWEVAVGYASMFAVFGFVMNSSVTGSIAKLLAAGGDAAKTSIDRILTGARVVLFLAVFLILVLTNTYIVYVLIMKGTQTSLAAQITALVTAAVVGVAFILCNDVTFIRIFENTVGYAVLDAMYGLDTVMEKYVQHGKNNEKTGGAINELFKLGFLFTAFRMDNFKEAMQMFQDKGEDGDNTETKTTFQPDLSWIDGKGDANHLNTLAELVVKKHLIGHLCWIYFSALAATTVACKFLARNT